MRIMNLYAHGTHSNIYIYIYIYIYTYKYIYIYIYIPYVYRDVYVYKNTHQCEHEPATKKVCRPGPLRSPSPGMVSEARGRNYKGAAWHHGRLVPCVSL